MPTKIELQEHPTEVLRAWFVHFYTALGLPCAFGALLMANAGRARDVFLFFILALVIDGTDGPMARKFNVLKWAPRFDGRKLDDITDYLTYVFVPAYFIYRFNLITGPWIIALLFALLASGFGFSNIAAKTNDKCFVGFPSYWNVVAFFLYLLQPPVAVSAILVTVLAVLIFIPVKYDSTQSMSTFEKLVILPLLVLGCLFLLLTSFDNPPQWLVYLLLLYPIYHIGHALIAYARGDHDVVVPETH